MKQFIKTRANDTLKFTTNMKEVPTSLGSNLYHYWNSNSEADSDVPVGIDFSGRDGGANLPYQSQCKVKQNQSNLGSLSVINWNLLW